MDYTNLYNFLSNNGVVVPNDKNVLLGIQTKFQEIFGTDIDLSAETPVGRLIEAFAVVVKSTLGVTAQTANQFNVNEATGIYLDAIGQIYDLKRIAGTKTRINIKCFFSDNTSGTNTIPAGSLIMCSSNGELFTVDSAIVNNGTQRDEDDRIFAMGTATAVNTGPVIAPLGTVNSIQTAVMGWTGVTNVAPTYTGTDIETDEAFRKRIIASRPIGVGFETHLVSALNRLDGVYSNCVLENNTGTDMVKKGVALPPHSIYVCVDCIETEELLAQIAAAIAKVKPVGTSMVDSENTGATRIERTVEYGYQKEDSKASSGYSQNIIFYKAAKTAIHVDLNYSYGNYTGNSIETDIASVVSEYVDTIGVGGTVNSPMIANWLITKLNIGVSSIWIQKDGSQAAADTTVEMNGYETAYTSPDFIVSTQV